MNAVQCQFYMLYMLHCILFGFTIGRLTDKPQDDIAGLGETISLTCRTSLIATPVNWSQRPFNSESILATNRIYVQGTVPPPKRDHYRVDTVSATGQYSLVITTTTANDAGMYVCNCICKANPVVRNFRHVINVICTHLYYYL